MELIIAGSGRLIRWVYSASVAMAMVPCSLLLEGQLNYGICKIILYLR